MWASWKDPETGDRLRTCTIITGAPNDTVAPIHDRMPMMLPEASWSAWLDPAQTDPDALLSMLTVAPASTLATHPVSTLVNKVANNLPQLIAPLTTAAAQPLPLELPGG